MSTPFGVPPLESLSGGWVSRADLAHLPSLRNQWGQAHVNADLTSLSWLAIPPYSGGYHTGVLRVNDVVPVAEEFCWQAWGVRRRAVHDGVEITTDTRMGYEATNVMWQTVLRNTSDATAGVTVRQELLAPFAHSETGWGWLYGTPWNDGHYHDFFATERIRAETTAPSPRQVQLIAPGPRYVRLGRPRIPGIQRDEDSAPMLLESELPNHTSPDDGWVRLPSALATIRLEDGREFELSHGESEFRLEPVELPEGSTLSFEVCLSEPGQTGVLLTHGNHPDSVQFGVEEGLPWLRIAGEKLVVPQPLDTGRFHRLEVTVTANGASFLVDGSVVARTEPWWSDQRWHASTEDGMLLVEDSRTMAWSVYSFALEPDSLTAQGSRGFATWTVTLRPGETASLGTALRIAPSDAAPSDAAASDFAGSARAGSARAGSDGAGSDAGAVANADCKPVGAVQSGGAVETRGPSARSGADENPGAIMMAPVADRDGFGEEFDGIARQWQQTWAAAFTPGNHEFSGHLPTLVTEDAGLSRSYYLGALLAIYMRNTGVSPIGPVFLTGGPRLGPTITFYWDLSEWARTASMLEPAGIRAWILAALGQAYDRSHSFDTRNLLPVGNHYSANDHALFRIVQHYTGVTGDRKLLTETAGGKTVLDHLRAMAYRHRQLRASFGGHVLADFGRDPWELLECVPNYRDAVVGFNAGYVGMLRSLAQLLRLLGEETEAAQADAEAAGLATAVTGQYAAGGRWMIAHPEGNETIGHCLDFALVTADMPDDLTGIQRGEMVEFVRSHLLDGDWMRALSPDDPIAPLSDRPDHGSAGAFCAWPGATAYGLSRLGRADLAQQLLSRVHASTSGGLWGQAMEATGDGRYRVAERGSANRDSVAGVAVTEAVIAGLFGIHAGFGDLTTRAGSLHGPAGELRNVNGQGFPGYLPWQ